MTTSATFLTSLHINGDCVESVNSFKFLGDHITDDLSWSAITSLKRNISGYTS